jgi:hypothetical protein
MDGKVPFFLRVTAEMESVVSGITNELPVLRFGNHVNTEAVEPPGSQGASKRRVPSGTGEMQRRETGWIDGRM